MGEWVITWHRRKDCTNFPDHDLIPSQFATDGTSKEYNELLGFTKKITQEFSQEIRRITLEDEELSLGKLSHQWRSLGRRRYEETMVWDLKNIGK